MSLFDRLFGKRAQPQAQSQSAFPFPISPEFGELLDNSAFYLKSYDEINISGWNFGKQETFGFNQTEGIMRFYFADGTVIECPAQAIGSFNTAVNTWAWAWANPSIGDNIKVDAQKSYEYGKEHQLPALTTPEYPADITWAWRMTAFAASGCRAEGAYCATMGPLRMFFTFRDVKIIPPSEHAE